MLNKRKTVYYTLIFCLLLLFSILFVYRDFLFGDRLFVSMRTASDSYGQFYPLYLNEARIFSKLGFARYMDFSRGIGKVTSNVYFMDLRNIPIYFGEENVCYVMLFRHLSLVFISGLSIYGLVKSMGKSSKTAIISGFLYAFCGPILVRQLWVGYIFEYSMFAVWLWSFEILYSRRRWFIFPFATALLLNSVSVPLVYYIILPAYILFRLIWDEKIVKTWKKSLGAFAAIIAFLFYSGKIGDLYRQVVSRISSRRMMLAINGENALQSVLGRNGYLWGSKEELLNLYVRSIGTNTPSTPGRYIGPLNYLEGPSFYCGILILMCFIPIILTLDKRKKTIAFFILFLAICYIFFNPIRLLSNGMVKDTFKLTSFWITAFVIFVFADGFDEFENKITGKLVIFIAIEAIVLIAIGGYCILFTENEKSNVILAVIFICLYTFVFVIRYFICSMTGCSLLLANSIGNIFAAFCVIEVVLQGMLCVDKIETVDKTKLLSRTAYNDYTVEALNYIYAQDPLRDYRIDKQYKSYGYNDSAAQDYYSTTCYIGGMGMGKDIADFYDAMSISDSEGTYNEINPTSINIYFNTFVGTKYAITKSPMTMNYGYDMLWSNNGVYVYENINAIPLAYICENYIKKEDFEKLSYIEKNYALLQAVIIGDEFDAPESMTALLPKDYYISEDTMDGSLNSFAKYKTEVILNNDGYYNIKRGLEEDEVLVLEILNGNNNVFDGKLVFLDNTDKTDYYIKMNSNEKYIYEICGKGICDFSLLDYYEECGIEIKELSAYIIPKDEYYKKYNSIIEEINKNKIDCEHFDEISTSGDVNSRNGGIMVTSLNYEGVEIYMDDEPVDVIKVNYGLAGCRIPPGKHYIKIKYGDHLSYRANSYMDKYLLYIFFGVIIDFCIYFKKRIMTNEKSQ